jgi:predicted outer membrane repeat protein
MYNYYSSPTLASCTFFGNSAVRGRGGGMTDYYYSSSYLTNCTFTENSAQFDKGGGINSDDSITTLANCILWENSAEVGTDESAQISADPNETEIIINYSCIQGWTGTYGGTGNTGEDPRFARPGYPPPPPPLFKASEPNPPDGSTGVDLYADLSWTPGYDAISHDVYFGTTNPPLFVCNQTSTTFDPGTMASDTTYYWRINEVNDSAVTTGDIWSFTTLSPPPPPPLLSASYMGHTGQYIPTEADYRLLPGSPCIDAGDPNYIPEPNETDLDGNPRIIGGRIDMGAYEYNPPIQAEVGITPKTINPEDKGSWIKCCIWLPHSYNVTDIDPDTVLLEDQINAASLTINEKQQVAIARFNRREVQTILDIGEVELTITGQFNDANSFVGKDVVRVTKKASGKRGKYIQASNPNPPDGATEVDIDADLSWTAGTDVTSHDVYFGISSPPPFIIKDRRSFILNRASSTELLTSRISIKTGHT